MLALTASVVAAPVAALRAQCYTGFSLSCLPLQPSPQALVIQAGMMACHRNAFLSFWNLLDGDVLTNVHHCSATNDHVPASLPQTLCHHCCSLLSSSITSPVSHCMPFNKTQDDLLLFSAWNSNLHVFATYCAEQLGHPPFTPSWLFELPYAVECHRDHLPFFPSIVSPLTDLILL